MMNLLWKSIRINIFFFIIIFLYLIEIIIKFMYVRVIIKSKIGSGVWGTTSRCTYESSALYELYLGI